MQMFHASHSTSYLKQGINELYYMPAYRTQPNRRWTIHRAYFIPQQYSVQTLLDKNARHLALPHRKILFLPVKYLYIKFDCSRHFKSICPIQKWFIGHLDTPFRYINSRYL